MAVSVGTSGRLELLLNFSRGAQEEPSKVTLPEYDPKVCAHPAKQLI